MKFVGNDIKEEKEIKSLKLRIVCAIFLCFLVVIEDYLNLYPNFLGIYAKNLTFNNQILSSQKTHLR